MNITNHFSNIRKDFRGKINFDVRAWYPQLTTNRQETHTGLFYDIDSFIKKINTTLHIRIAYRQKRGFTVYGK